MRAGRAERRLALVAMLAVLCVLAPAPSLPAAEAGAAAARDGDDARAAVVLTVEGAIGPASADYVERGLERAAERGGVLVILRLDTPGGLDASMRDINHAIIASPIPVVGFVAPSGARAASAGTYILYATHVAAMAPATNLGAATPVQLGGLPSLPSRPAPSPAGDESPEHGGGEDAAPDAEKKPAAPDAMTKKIVNDAVAYIRGLARMRGRNEDWAARAVREGVSLTAEDALAAGVIDLVAPDERALLDALDGRRLELQGVEITLDTRNLPIERIEPDWRTELLSIIASPNVAYILMLLGIYGLFFELSSPGAIIPGVAGAICLVLAMFALQMLPLNYAGLALIVLGIAFMIGELLVPSFGALGVGGVIAFAIGSVILFDTDSPQLRVSLSIIFAATALTGGFFLLAVRALFRARRGPVVSGLQQLLGARGEALEDFEASGQIRIGGEIWSARSARPVRAGETVEVTSVDGLTLEVQPVKEEHS